MPDAIASRLIGSLFVERGLVSESQIRVALEMQRETGAQLGQILVDQFGVSRKELTRIVAEQWRDVHGGDDPGSGPDAGAGETWRPLGEIFVTRGFVSEDELDAALQRQRKTGERLGEALVALGVISKFELAGALGEQMATLRAAEEAEAQAANVVSLHPRPASEQPEVEAEEAPTLALVDEVVEPEVAEPEAVEPEVDAIAEVDVAEAMREPEPTFETEPVYEIRPTYEVEPAFEVDPVLEVELEQVPAPGLEDDVFPTEREPAGYEVAAVLDAEDGTRVAETVEDWLVPAPDPGPEREPARFVAYASTPWGYRLVELDVELPSVGDVVDVPDVGVLVVSRVGRSPLPLDTRLCVFAEQPLAAATR